jgi:hypothetical protein
MKYKRVKSAVMLAGASFFLCVVFLVALNAISSVAIVGVSEWRRASNIQKLGDQLAALPNYLGREQEVRQIVAFLGTLTGDVPKQFKEAPQLPVAAFQRP